MLVDASVNAGQASFRVLANTAQTMAPGYAGTHPVGSTLTVGSRDGVRFLEIRVLEPSEVLILINS